PLSQLVVEDETSKGGKRKKKTETGRISMEVPVKEGPSLAAVGGEVAKLVQSPSKKRKISVVVAGETGKGKGTAAPQPSSSHTAPAAPQGDSPSAW
ncbi:hypothetical protein A2U01_0075003, partial [Trifolium medium]|nr:hypothetical protein [Trifolium medium]